jgi:protein-tyrosine phosphatase
MTDRSVSFEGCFNTRDLGAIKTTAGRYTRRGVVVRSDSVSHLTAKGWQTVYDYGIRTIIDLRNNDERKPDASPRHEDFTTTHVALDGVDPEFWAYWGGGPRFCCPLYYKPHIERFPDLSAAVISAIANAKPGGILVHCVAGRDRTGIISMLLLHLAGVSADEIADDNALSQENLARLHAHRGSRDEWPIVEAFLAKEGKTTHQLIQETLAAGDMIEILHRGGLTKEDLFAVRQRFIGK